MREASRHFPTGRDTLAAVLVLMALTAALGEAAQGEAGDASAATPAQTGTATPPETAASAAGAGHGGAAEGLKVTASAEALERFGDTPVGLTAAGYPFRGDPEAPVILVEYSDYLCPFCGRHFQQTLPALLDQYVRTGRLRLVFRDFPIAKLHPTAPRGAEAALCVAEQGPALFWKMHDALFRRQGEWNRLPDPNAFLAGLVQEIGADPAAYAACLAAGQMAARVEASVAEGRALGFNGTPSFQYVNAETGDTYQMVGAQPAATFAKWTDALLAGEAPPEPKKRELPLWAKPESLAPDGDRPGLTVAGNPYKGNPQAPLTVVEFTDFQCPSCRRHALETQPPVDREFVETGKILWVAKHLPLRMHPHAPAAAVAAECAAAQGKFWEMHHLLFEKQDQWVNGNPDLELTALSKATGLDTTEFETCFNGRKALERVLSDIYDAQGATRTTPTFVFIYGDKASVVRGTRDAERFLAVVRKLHEAASQEQDSTQTARR